MKNVFGSLREFIDRHSHINWALADQAVVSGVNFLTGILLARHLGLHEFGMFVLAWMAVLFVNSLQNALIISPMMSIGPKQSEKDLPAYFGFVFVQQATMAVTAFMLLYAGVLVSAFYFPQWGVADLAITLPTTAVAYIMQDFVRRYFFTRGKPDAAFANDIVSYVGQVLLLLLMFYTDLMSVANALWIIAFTSSLAVFYGIWQIERPRWIDKNYFMDQCKYNWGFSKWLVASSLLQWTSGNLFSIAAGVYLGAGAAGAMKVCQNIMGVLHIMFLGLANVIPVRAAQRLKEGGAKSMIKYLRKIFFFGEGVTALFAILVLIAPGLLIMTIYGDEYAGYGYLLRGYVVMYMLVFFSVPLRAGLRALEHTQPIFWAYVLSTSFSVTFAAPLTRGFGLDGVIWGMCITQVILQSFLTLSLFRKIRLVSN